MTLAIHTNVYVANSILEVGCGSGVHGLHLQKTMLKPKAVMALTDLSDRMLDLAVENFLDSRVILKLNGE